MHCGFPLTNGFWQSRYGFGCSRQRRGDAEESQGIVGCVVVGIGEPANRSDLFRGKTLKLFLETDIGSSKLIIVPELFLTDDYKEAIMGVKLGYRF